MATPLLSPASTPPVAPQRTGALLAAAVPGDGNARWTSGVTVWYEGPLGWRVVSDCSDVVTQIGPKDALAPTAGRPWLIQAATECPRTDIARMSARASARLEAITGRGIARELWTGEHSRADPYELLGSYDWTNPEEGGGYANPHFTAATGDDVLPAADDPLEAIGAVEQAVAERLVSGVPYIHVPLRMITPLAQFLTRQGDLILTEMGSVIVADYGYPGTGPDGTGIWAYGTGPVTTWTRPVDVLDDPSQVVALSDNSVEVWAERPALALFDPTTLVACQVT